MDDWRRQALRHLHDQGYRRGASRGAIIDALNAEPCCLTVQEIVAESGSGLATVYRALDTLIYEGLAAQVDPGDGTARFEALRSEPHHHLVCRSCGAVQPIVSSTLSTALDEVEDSERVAIVPKSAMLKGYCADCA